MYNNHPNQREIARPKSTAKWPSRTSDGKTYPVTTTLIPTQAQA